MPLVGAIHCSPWSFILRRDLFSRQWVGRGSFLTSSLDQPCTVVHSQQPVAKRCKASGGDVDDPPREAVEVLNFFSVRVRAKTFISRILSMHLRLVTVVPLFRVLQHRLNC